MSKRSGSLLACLVLLVGLVATAPPASATTRYKVYLAQSATSLPVGRTVTFTGSVSPNAAGLSVRLQRYFSGAWHDVATKTLTSSSHYSFAVALASVGTRSYRVAKSRTGSYAGGVSRTVRVTAFNGFKSVTIGWGHGCALKYDKSLWCWGYGNEGELGLGFGEFTSQKPVRVGTATWNSVSAGEFGNCGIRTDGSLWCWGSFEISQGTLQTAIAGTHADRFVPTRIGTQTSWSSVSTGAWGVCARRASSTAACWTRDDVYNADPNNVTPQNEPYNDWRTIQVSTWSGPGCGLRLSQQIWCLPASQFDQPYLDVTGYWNMYSPGFGHICGVKIDDTAWCWGDSTYGATGPNPTSDVPLKFDSASWRTVSAGRDFTCGIKTAGSLWCWGRNDDGRLGAGASAPAQSQTALRVGTASDWTSVATAFYGCGTRKDGSLWCWGEVLAPGDDPSQPVTHPTPFRMG